VPSWPLVSQPPFLFLQFGRELRPEIGRLKQRFGPLQLVIR
jgi:hypothetical protein